MRCSATRQYPRRVSDGVVQIIPNYQHSNKTDASAPGGIIVSDTASTYGKKYSDKLYFDCTTSDITLQGVEAPSVVLRCDTLKSLSVSSSRIGRLVIAAGSGNVNFLDDGFSNINTVVIGGGGGTVTLGGSIPNVEITGDGRTVLLNGSCRVCSSAAVAAL